MAISDAAVDLLDVPQLAALFHVTRGAIRKALREGRLPGLRHGRRWFVRRSTFDRWLEDQEHAAGGGSVRPAVRATSDDVARALAP